MSEVTEAYESGKAVGRCQGARDMELAIALDNIEHAQRSHNSQSTQAILEIAAQIERGSSLVASTDPDVVEVSMVNWARQLRALA